MQILVRNLKGVSKRGAEFAARRLSRRTANRMRQLPAARAEVVQSENVVCMTMREDRRFNQPHSFSHQLQSQFWRRVDDERPAQRN